MTTTTIMMLIVMMTTITTKTTLMMMMMILSFPRKPPNMAEEFKGSSLRQERAGGTMYGWENVHQFVSVC